MSVTRVYRLDSYSIPEMLQLLVTERGDRIRLDTRTAPSITIKGKEFEIEGPVLDEEGRRRIVAMMWEIIFADRSASESENNIVWRAADLLGVSSRERLDLRRRFAAERAAAIACSPPGR